MKPRIRLIVVDDHPVVRDGLKGMLASQSDLEIAGEAANGEEAVALAGRVHPDVVLMDLRMPVLDGVAATARIRERWPEVRVLVLTTYDADADILRAVEAGATSYILKDAPREELFRAISATARGEPYLAPSVATRLMSRVRAPNRDAMSAREVEVLSLVSRGASNKEIARQLRLSEATIKSHLLHIFAKLGVSDRTQAVTLAVRKGIIRLEA
jgi:DNA-binding NarL/FixJ family response regulator